MSVSTAIVLLLEWMETFVDQTVVCSPSTSLRFPSLPIFKLEAESLATRGFSLFATHRIERARTFLYHSPTNSFLELPGLKNPNSNIPPAETRLWFTESRWDGVKVSSAVQYSVKRIKACERERKQNFNSLAISGMTTAHLVNEAESTLSKLVFKRKVVSSRNHTAEAEKCQGRSPFLSSIGFSLLATQITDSDFDGIPLYQIPTYLLLVPGGLKNPRANFFPPETMVSPSLITLPGPIWLAAKQNGEKQSSKNQEKVKKAQPFWSLEPLAIAEIQENNVWDILERC
nr:hypothetical protein PRUPE_4G033100 [Ipomoea batatas]